MHFGRMASKRPKFSRAGTMQQTAEEGVEFLERHGIESPLAEFEHGIQVNDHKKQADLGNDTETTPIRLKRQSTMAETAKEGAEFLQREGYTSDSPDGSLSSPLEEEQETPKVKRASTMEVTAKEGAEFLSRMEDEKKKTVRFKSHVPKLQRDSTIDLTVKEGEEFLKRTGGIKENGPEEHSVDTPSRPKLQRDSTIDVTVKEGEEFIRRSGAMLEEKGDEISSGNHDEDDDDTGVRDDENDNGGVPSLVRDSTMKETAKIGEQFVGEEGRAESRSQTAVLREAERESGTTKPPLKRAGTMDVTKAEGEEFLKRKRT